MLCPGCDERWWWRWWWLLRKALVVLSLYHHRVCWQSVAYWERTVSPSRDSVSRDTGQATSDIGPAWSLLSWLATSPHHHQPPLHPHSTPHHTTPHSISLSLIRLRCCLPSLLSPPSVPALQHSSTPAPGSPGSPSYCLSHRLNTLLEREKTEFYLSIRPAVAPASSAVALSLSLSLCVSLWERERWWPTLTLRS